MVFLADIAHFFSLLEAKEIERTANFTAKI